MAITPEALKEFIDFSRAHHDKNSGASWIDIPPDSLLGRLIAQAPAMYELLKELEWCHGEWLSACPLCKSVQHYPDCRLAAVLKAVEGE